MREISKAQKERLEDEREKERLKRDAEEKENLKKVAEDEDDGRGRKMPKPKKPKKERSDLREERPLTHGAHGIARQDGLDLPVKGIH
jgi:transcriptional adapter 3